jgi:hypothetical protein
MVYQQRRGVTGKPVRLGEPPPLLAGRDDLLAELDARLSGGDSSGPQTVALWGMGGVGKTSVAVAYARQHLDEVGVAWQFTAYDPTVLEAEFGELAAQLGERDVVDARDPVASVHGILAAFRAGWLLLFDNVSDRASVERFLPPAGPGRILITSQNPNWPHGQPLQVPLLSAEIAAEFLVGRTSDQDRQAARDLAREMDGLPLALEQAAAYILATEGTLARYLSLFRQRRAEMLRRGEPAGYSGTLATAWSLAFDRLEQSAPQAVGLLRLLAFCAPEAVPLVLLLQARPGLTEKLPDEVAPVLGPMLEDELAAKDAVAALRRYSLVRPAGDGLVSVHRLVQAVTADQMPAGLAWAWRQAAAAVIDAAIPGDPRQPSTWSAFAALLPHVRAVLSLASDDMWRLANYLGWSGNYSAARDLLQLIVDAANDAYGPEHQNTLTARSDLAYWTGNAGDAAAARDQFAALLPIYERVLGPEYQDSLHVRGNLASFTGRAGDAVGARDQYAALLPTFERVLGSEHPDTLTARANLASFTGVVGDAAGARDQFAALLPTIERVLGPEDPETLAIRNNVAASTGRAGDAAGARDQFAALLPIRERVLGPEHPDTLAARNNLAHWTGEAGDAAGSRDQLAVLLPILERVHGREHPDTLATRANLASATGLAGDAAGARDQYAALLPIRERVLGPEHPDTLATRNNLAHWTGEAGDAAGARDQYAALVPIFERVLGDEHPETLSVRADLDHWTEQADGTKDTTRTG